MLLELFSDDKDLSIFDMQSFFNSS